MSLSIYNARLLDPATETDEIGAIHIENGQIAHVSTGQTSAHKSAKTSLDAAGLCLSPGLVDIRVKTGEPGEEHRETLATAARAAAAGGITSLVVMPDTTPVLDDVALVRFIRERARETACVNIYPYGALTTGLNALAMAEIGLMSDAGAVAFTNGDAPVANAGVLKRAMTYAASRGAAIVSRPDVAELRGSGVMNAGALAARMGLGGIPEHAEYIGAARDIALAEVTGCKLILDQVSTVETLDAVIAARKRGAHIHTMMAAHTLFFNELDVGDYLTYCKVNPPFRSEDTRQSLISAVKAGLIDAVVSAHDPQPPEEKRLPFGEASFGAAGLETLLASMLSLVHDGPLTILEALRPLTASPAALLGLNAGTLATGAPADLTLFDPGAPWLCNRDALRSRSTNSPYDGRRLQGKVTGTWVSGQRVFDSSTD